VANIFNTINTAFKSLQVQKTSLDTVGHNIANANNDAYSRQRVLHRASEAYPVPALTKPHIQGQIGTGVEIEKIERIKDQFIEDQIREELCEQGKWDKIAQGLQRIELTFNEPSDSSLNGALNQFWQSLQDLGNQPEDPATRATVRERATVLTDTFHTLNEQLYDYQESLNADVASTVDKINSLARRIADMNKQIISIKSSGDSPNDLLDNRDALFIELNELIDTKGREDNRGNLEITIGGITLVDGNRVNELLVNKAQTMEERNHDTIIFSSSGEEIYFTGGELKGIFYIRDVELENYLDKIDTIAENLVERFNEVHKQGYDLYGHKGEDFFTIDSNFLHSASTIGLTDEIKDDLNKIACGNYSDRPDIVTVKNLSGDSASRYSVDITTGSGVEDFDYEIRDNNDILIDSGSVNSGEEIDLSATEGIILTIYASGEANLSLSANPGSGTNAIDLADALKKDNIIEDSSITEYYESMISSMGVDSQRANQMVNNQEVLLNQLNNQKTSISGVSLDEEMANMIKYQHAYNAAAKIISRTEEIIQTLLDMV
jgi:flagellar hook-associated protein 1